MPEASPSAPLDGPLVVAVAYDGLCTFEFGVVVEVFGLPRPEMGDGWYRFAVAALEAGPMRAEGGIRVLADGGMELLDAADVIVIPGWRGADAPVPHLLCSALKAAAERGARLLSICSGAFVLAAAGVLEGKRATTHWRYIERLGHDYPRVIVTPDVLYIDEGTVMTSAGSAAGIDLCIHMVRRDFGSIAANTVARRLVIPAHRSGAQTQLLARPVPEHHESSRLSGLTDRIREQLGRQWNVRELAALAGMSERTFLRRFEAMAGMTPARWIAKERLSRALDLLEATKLPIEVVAQEAGFATTASLRHHFRQHFSTSPAAYRRSCRTAQSESYSPPATLRTVAVM